MTQNDLATGAVVRSAELVFEPHDGFLTARAVGERIGARLVRLDVVRLAAGRSWTVPDSADELTVVVLSGSGTGQVGDTARPVRSASTMHGPTGSTVRVRADDRSDMVLYVWLSGLLPGRPTSGAPRLFGSLWDTGTQLRNFAGTGQLSPAELPATMNFIFWPGTGSAQLCLHCGIQEPGETFSVHLHPESEDAFVAFEGAGQMYLRDRWIDVQQGDVLFAPPMVLHGARNPHRGRHARRFVTCGGPTPFDPFLYDAAGACAEVR
ncbi:MAG: cupin domain-containing protein [Actinobacteria bacterium]|nr:cupin domain-containing protein [Actinomycetota bacterium]